MIRMPEKLRIEASKINIISLIHLMWVIVIGKELAHEPCNRIVIKDASLCILSQQSDVLLISRIVCPEVQINGIFWILPPRQAFLFSWILNIEAISSFMRLITKIQLIKQHHIVVRILIYEDHGHSRMSAHGNAKPVKRELISTICVNEAVLVDDTWIILWIFDAASLVRIAIPKPDAILIWRGIRLVRPSKRIMIIVGRAKELLKLLVDVLIVRKMRERMIRNCSNLLTIIDIALWQSHSWPRLRL